MPWRWWGQWARFEATPESDVDLLVLTNDVDSYRRDTVWSTELELGREITAWHDTDHNPAWSRHLTVDYGLDIDSQPYDLSLDDTAV